MSAAHPRSRGEHFVAQKFGWHFRGSSPLARGTPDDPLRDQRIPRLIPARAGNTKAVKDFIVPSPAHPRSRGEHTQATKPEAQSFGSSPLARGTPCHCSKVTSFLRLIPARAGNTSWQRKRSRRSPAHPRSRGEHDCRACAPSLLFGSSPLARGTRPAQPVPYLQERLIPARAGNTDSLFNCPGGFSAHPRSRGEHTC